MSGTIEEIYVSDNFEEITLVWSDMNPEDNRAYALEQRHRLVWERPKPAFKAGDKIRWVTSGIIDTVIWCDEMTVVAETEDSHREIWDADYLKSATEVVNDES